MPKAAPGIERIRQAIRQALIDQHISQNDLAQRAGIASSTIGNILSETHPHRPSPETLRALASHIHVPVEALLTWAGHVPPLLHGGDEKIMATLRLAIPYLREPFAADHIVAYARFVHEWGLRVERQVDQASQRRRRAIGGQRDQSEPDLPPENA